MTTNKKWFVKGDEVGYISDHDDQSYGMFCAVSVVYDEEYARLIAAAPELLEALQMMLNNCHDLEKDDAIIAAVEAANAAIAKATGTQP